MSQNLGLGQNLLKLSENKTSFSKASEFFFCFVFLFFSEL